jgi:hypothetical protein
MMYTVWQNGQIVGKVHADNETEAFAKAEIRYGYPQDQLSITHISDPVRGNSD